MAKVTHIVETGNLLKLFFDNGTVDVAYPSQGGYWFVGGLVKYMIQAGNQLKLYYSNATMALAYPTQGGTWIIDAAGGSIGTTFKWPFSSTGWTTYPMHSGLDWARAAGTAIKVIGDGEVIQTYNQPANTYPSDSSEPAWRGHCIVVDHGFIDGHEIWSLYAHMLNPPTLAVGAGVVGGQTIGGVGNTGYSTGNHLHFEVIYDGIRLSESVGGGAERTDAWMDAHTDGSNW